ncbi:carbohydrate porin [Vibrio marisflavi]|uniref:Maltoporin n=1 Tax=Vibrio marisflavi CECT 7928 TaxID=634439 RepID=A0ABN8E2C7_9VIBR|nr:carbohydrate porin [Vibrio marisflavi]CAH0538542.1 Maltoporin [Vibrio marisflavi CECT 7928]
MKSSKLLPVVLSVSTAILSIPSYADNKDIDDLSRRIQELEEKFDKEYSEQESQQPEVLSSQSDDTFGIHFSGYARYGAAYQAGDSKLVSTDDALNGNATGRLGNEGNGGEFQFGKTFSNDTGAIWNIDVMFNHWGDNVEVPKAYAGVTNLYESQPNLYIWAGRNFNQRIQTDLNDYYWMTTDGQGAGFNNFALSETLKLDASFVSAVDSGPDDSSNGDYAITTTLHGISFGESSGVTLYANWGFDDKSDANSGNRINAYQVAAKFNLDNNNIVVRYSDNAKDKVLDKTKDQQALLFSFDGSYDFNQSASVAYLTAFQTYKDGEYSQYDRKDYNAVVRPMYFWDDVNSTWLEFGYDRVDFSNEDITNSSWKVTLSQNISFGKGSDQRPMLRFYTTVGDADNEQSIGTNGAFTSATKQDTLTVGAMWEAWW